ncbi:uncharacterized protein [Dysidea avara]|uniref:uncharacterized protein n=1 Tax=Dysidea avara TaxID=196820 RepID=UPI00332136CE
MAAAVAKGFKGAYRFGVSAFTTIKGAFSNKKVTTVPYKLLLIGETGSGKTSFLNLLCNSDMVKKLGFEPALENFDNFSDIEMENAHSKAAESKTSGATLYSITLNDLEIGIIDTPGFGDTRGMDQDIKNVKTIVDALKEIDHVNCVCLVINGRLARMTTTLQYVLAEITAILPRNVLDNVIIVFTNTSSALDLNFDAESLKEYFGKEIEKCFMIENPYCQFEKAKAKQGKIANKLIVEALKEGFDRAYRELSKIHEAIKDFKAVHTHHFTTLYEKKQQIECQVLDIKAAYDSQVELSQELKKAQEKIEAAQRTKKLNKDFQTYTTVTRWNRVSTLHHNTLCGAPGCYIVCHEGCGLTKSFDPETFKHCAGVGGKTCKTCGHDYRSHHHNEVKMVKETKSVPLINDEMKKRFEEADSTDKMAAMAKSKIESQISTSEEEKKTLSHNLLLIMEEFHKLGLNKNYAKILETHLFTIQQRKEASDNQEDIANLTKTEEEIKKKLDVVRTTLNEPWSPKADPEAQRDWACKMLELDPSSMFGIDEVDKAFKALVLVNHPDKQGNPEVTKKLNRAREILKQE